MPSAQRARAAVLGAHLHRLLTGKTAPAPNEVNPVVVRPVDLSAVVVVVGEIVAPV